MAKAGLLLLLGCLIIIFLWEASGYPWAGINLQPDDNTKRLVEQVRQKRLAAEKAEAAAAAEARK